MVAASTVHHDTYYAEFSSGEVFIYNVDSPNFMDIDSVHGFFLRVSSFCLGRSLRRAKFVMILYWILVIILTEKRN